MITNIQPTQPIVNCFLSRKSIIFCLQYKYLTNKIFFSPLTSQIFALINIKMVKQHIAFIHPDLGIGGAQQLVVNLCLAGKKHNFEPHIWTPYHHKSFPETHDGTIRIHQHGSFFGLVPDTVFGRLKGILAYIRSVICVFSLVFFNQYEYSVVIADQVSVVLPILRIFGYKTIFYCHYPDKLLSGSRKNPLKVLYRFVIDLIEEISLIFADKIYVNSEFTKDVFYSNFKILKKLGVQVEVLYPALDFSQFDKQIAQTQAIKKMKSQINGKYFFSLNRYERKKNINLAIEAFSLMIKNHPEKANSIKLVVAGGYDPKVTQNKEHLIELQNLAKQLGVQSKVHFYVSISNQERKFLLKNAEAVLYTPENEHFGIVPCEAMYCSVPVIADNSGGPKQSVGVGCGYLCTGGKEDWSEKMWKILSGEKEKLTKGKERMIKRFGLEMFALQFRQGIEKVKKK